MNFNALVNMQDNQQVNSTTGVVIGIVTSNQDPEERGRIKVKFPWRDDEGETYWARLASLMAGSERGAVFYPEPDDEVLIAFEHGDINHPYIIGALWNGQDKPPETNSDGKNNIRKIRSRSGHELVFNDDSEQKKEKVEIHTNGGHVITLDDAQGSEKVEINSKSGHKILLNDAAGSEKIEIVDKSGSNKIGIDSLQNSISIECSMQLKIKANMIEIESSSMMKIKAGAILTLEGSLVKIN